MFSGPDFPSFAVYTNTNFHQIYWLVSTTTGGNFSRFKGWKVHIFWMNTTARAAHVTEYFYIFFNFTFTHPDLPFRSARMTWLRFGKQKFSSLGFLQEVARTKTQDTFWYQNSKKCPSSCFFHDLSCCRQCRHWTWSFSGSDGEHLHVYV